MAGKAGCNSQQSSPHPKNTQRSDQRAYTYTRDKQGAIGLKIKNTRHRQISTYFLRQTKSNQEHRQHCGLELCGSIVR
jgi:hypothetical protein